MLHHPRAAISIQRFGLTLIAVALIAALPWNALACESAESLDLPLGLTLPPTFEAVQPDPPWGGQAYEGDMVSVLYLLAAKACADVPASAGNAIDAAAWPRVCPTRWRRLMPRYATGAPFACRSRCSPPSARLKMAFASTAF